MCSVSVNYDNLTFDIQWDGTTFNTQAANGEKVGIIKTNYYTVTPGINLAWFQMITSMLNWAEV